MRSRTVLEMEEKQEFEGNKNFEQSKDRKIKESNYCISIYNCLCSINYALFKITTMGWIKKWSTFFISFSNYVIRNW